ncbi:MAG: insulinase family protein [Muribaculaceae bacterium]|nr:insulinase family protein [Muribaculaceae bacterium]
MTDNTIDKLIDGMATEDISVNRAVLSNGLRFVHHQMPDTSMVTLNVLYNVGARDERPDMTGIAHLFEHMMFGGSANVEDFDGLLTKAGGVSNAWTSNDFTNFHLTAPAHNAETLFYLESDRMLAPTLTEQVLNVQRSVVIEEFKQQCLNIPYGNLMHTLRPLMYGSHPYSWPVIGKDFESIAAITRHDITEWWTNHYSPDNAVLAVAGNIDYESALKFAKRWFEDIPSRSQSVRQHSPLDPVSNGVTQTVYGAVPATLIVVAYRMGAYDSDQYYAADAITDILSMGQASRFAQRINMNPDSPLVDADASISGAKDPGMLMLTARLADENVDIDYAIRFLVEAARSIINEGIRTEELQRLKNRQRASFVFGNMASVSCAQTIAEAEMHGHSPGYKLRRYNTLTCESIIDAAIDIFDSTHPVTVIYRPINPNSQSFQ